MPNSGGEGRSDHRAIRKAIDKLARKRRGSQPREASAGCIFKNPEEVSAGWLIDRRSQRRVRGGSPYFGSSRKLYC